MEKNRKGIKGRFTLYFKASMENVLGKYLLKKSKIKGNEMPVEEYEEVEDYGSDDILSQIGSATDKIFDGVMETKLLLDQIADNRLIQALAALSEQQNNIIFLRIFYEKTFAEIGEILGIPSKRAENTYFNAIKKIRKIIGGSGDVF